MRYLLHIAYKGTHYKGWQRQPDVISVQEVLESTLMKMLGKPTHCMGCGRTDAGVHASQFFCHLDITETWDYDFIFRLNKMLPDDIVAFEIFPVRNQFHAQHQAISRTYQYFIHFQKDPFLAEISYYHPDKDLDFEKMEQAAASLINFKDYRILCKTPDVYKTTLCEISQSKLHFNQEKTNLKFSITSNRFLRGMIRMIVGNLLEIGSGQLSLERFKESLEKGCPLPYFKAAFPQGLYLSEVVYPDFDIPARPMIF